jgi:hypothetical protein
MRDMTMRYTSRTMSRSRRILVAWLALLAMVFAQLGASAYACPLEEPASFAMDTGSHCDRMDAAQPNLCDKHCHDDQQAGAQANLPAAYVPSFIVTLAVPPSASAPLAGAVPTLRHAVDPPPTIRHCCWRI